MLLFKLIVLSHYKVSDPLFSFPYFFYVLPAAGEYLENQLFHSQANHSDISVSPPAILMHTLISGPNVVYIISSKWQLDYFLDP